MRNLLYFLTSLLLTACGNSSIPDDVKWEIIKEEPNENLSKNNIEIQLNKKLMRRF
ncbi:hypothetical protein NAT51_10135 [Flavobacterium amniphilum]|uniref:hypothetical protein n=1 Tax=Flavobacterium amniphilum TaxID=1834035 RepID=UPI00202A03F9|nr:hypothetical protein [Flavobacterium amniphilum]MCL9805882.1 hypothetical protein [Flavobacterium amniphilum]